MQINPESMALLIKGLTDMYSQPYQAVLREYTSNAWDSHLMAGVDRPVEVTLPSKLSPNLIIQDFGIGMSRKELSDFVQYGYSTKRGSDDAIGGFGLGSKSGLAVSTNFSVTAIKDGKKNVVVIGLRTDDTPHMGLLKETDTTEGNGVKITIPTSEYHRFEAAINKAMFLGWKPGSVLINGRKPEFSVYDEDKFISLGGHGWVQREKHDVAIADAYNGRAIVGPVSYSINWNEVGDIDMRLRNYFLTRAVLRLDIKDITLPNNRENLIYDPRTRQAIRDKVKAMVEVGREEYISAVTYAPNRREALIATSTAKRHGFDAAYTWQNERVELSGNRYYTLTEANVQLASSTISGIRNKKSTHIHRDFVNKQMYSDVLNKDGYVLVYGNGSPEQKKAASYYDNREHTAANKAVYLARALASVHPTLKRPTDFTFIYTDMQDESEDPWFFGAFERVLSFEDADAIASEYRKANMKAARATTKRRAPSAEEVRLLSGGLPSMWTTTVTMGTLDQSEKYILLQNGEDELVNTARRALTTYGGYTENPDLVTLLTSVKNAGYKYVVANKGVRTKHYGDNMTLVPLRTALAEVLSVNLVPLDALRATAAYDIRNGHYSWARHLDGLLVDKIEREETRNWVRAMKDKTLIADYNRLGEHERLAKVAGITVSVPKHEDAFDSPGARYPLIAGEYTVNEDAIPYINLMDKHVHAS